MTETVKASFVRDLELSVRTRNLLSAEGITTRAAFMALDKPTVMGWRNAIGRTWKDIAALQETSRQLAAVWNSCVARDAEIARLRGFLERIDCIGSGDAPPSEDAISARKLARAALQVKP